MAPLSRWMAGLHVGIESQRDRFALTGFGVHSGCRNPWSVRLGQGTEPLG